MEVIIDIIKAFVGGIVEILTENRLSEKRKEYFISKNECKGELKYEVKVTTIKRGVWLNEKNDGWDIISRCSFVRMF